MILRTGDSFTFVDTRGVFVDGDVLTCQYDLDSEVHVVTVYVRTTRKVCMIKSSTYEKVVRDYHHTR